MSEKAAVLETEGRFQTGAGVDLFYRRFAPAAQGTETPVRPPVILAICHGVGEHSGRYVAFGRRFAGRGIPVYALDLRGFGQSSGRRAHVGSFSDYLDDYEALIDLAHRENPGVPVVAYGHSMGGLLVLLYAVEKRTGAVAVIASAPAVRLKVKVAPSKLLLAKVAGRLAPTFSQRNEIPPAVLARNPEIGRAYEADPLVVRVVSAGWFLALNEAMARVAKGARHFDRPILLIQGTADVLTDASATEYFYQRCGSKDKSLKLYNGFFHEL
ncbi:MAG TPA: alpha/beta hydrolase, partial [Bacillota bacterium]